MKTFLPLLLVFFLASIFFSCEKESAAPKTSEEVPSFAKRINSNTKSEEMYSLTSKIGHKKDDCGDKCTTWGHKSCSGYGSYCPISGGVIGGGVYPFYPTKSSVVNVFDARASYPEDFSDEETLLMPNRSFFMEEDDTYLNVPEQVLVRDPETNCFLFKGLSITKEAMFVNL